jgi:hypothetical protein
MTSPEAHGYPDWGRFAARADVILNVDEALVLNADLTRGNYFVGNVEHVAFSFSGGAQPCNISVYWLADAAANVTLARQVITTRGNGGFDHTLPVAGPWMQIVISPVAFPTTVDLLIWTAAGPLASLGAPMAPEVLIAASNNVGAGANVTTTASRTAPGMAHFHAESALATWFATVDSIDAGGTVTRLAVRSQATALQTQLLFLPSDAVQIVRGNGTGASGQIIATLVRSGMGMIGQG